MLSTNTEVAILQPKFCSLASQALKFNDWLRSGLVWFGASEPGLLSRQVRDSAAVEKESTPKSSHPRRTCYSDAPALSRGTLGVISITGMHINELFAQPLYLIAPVLFYM